MKIAVEQSKIENQKSKIRNLVPALLEWFEKNARDLPWRRTRDPYAIWVSEIMLQQTQVKTVLPYWERWMGALPTVKSLAEAEPAAIHKLWEGLGYYTRVRNMQKAAREIMAQQGGKFPREYEAILALPGIGRYTAGAVASIAFNEPRAILDGNVMRVLARVFGVEGKVREKAVSEKLWRLAEELVMAAQTFSGAIGRVRDSSPRLLRTGQKCCSQLNQSLMELGALICTPTQPKCGLCPVRRFCDALRTGRVGKLPDLGKRAATTPRRFVAFIVEHRGRWLARQRPAGVVNAHLWEFPNGEINFASLEARGKRRVRARGLQEVAMNELGFAPARLEALCVIRHTITRYRITLEVYRGNAGRGTEKSARSGKWLATAEMNELAFTSAHRKILERL